jgi:membrane-associated phospholipid phosphatase
MKTRRMRIAAILLAVLLPLQILFAQAPVSGTDGDGPTRIFSLAIGGRAASAEPAPARADQSGPQPAVPAAAERYTVRNLAGDFLKDAGQIWSSPARIRSRDLLPLMVFAGAAGLLIAYDEPIYAGFRNFRENNAWVGRVSPVITTMGSYGAWGTAALFLGVGLAAKDGQAVETAVLAANAMLQSAILVTFVKGMTGRQRPEVAGGVDHWSGPGDFFEQFEAGQTGRYDSFPSDHAAAAFSLATVVAMEYAKNAWVGIAAYTVATGVGLSRVMLDKHWLSDVLVGAVVGHLIGRMVVRNHRRRYPVVPTVGVDHDSLSFALTYVR